LLFVTSVTPKREGVRCDLSIGLTDWRAVALESGVQLAVTGRLCVAEGRDPEGAEQN
jgi:hypothetical protein